MDISNIQEELHLKDYLQVFGRRRGIAILFYFIVILLVTIGTIFTTPAYEATVTLLIDVESPNVLTTSGSVALQSQNYYAYKEYFQTQQKIIVSQSMLQEAYDKFNIGNSDEYIGSIEPLKKFSKTVQVEPVRNTRLLKLHVINTDRKLAAKIANYIAEIYVKQNLYLITRSELTNLLKNEYLKLEAKLSEYSKTYKHKHPNMIRLKKEMVEMTHKINSLKKSSIRYGKNTENLESDYRYALEGFKANNVRVLDPAAVPIKPIKPKKRINLMLGFIIGIFGGIGLAFFFEYLDDTLQGIIDLKKLVNWPLLGSVPKILSGGKRSRYLISNNKPTDPASESYRSIRTSITFSVPKNHIIKSLVITSPGPDEGKTTTLCNLGIVFAQSKKRVLLVDGDMRKPRLSSIFKDKKKIGLSNFLNDQVAFDDIVDKTEIENLFIVTSGVIPINTSELLSNEKMNEFMKRANENFDLILFDSPPVPIVTDATILANLADVVIVVVQKGITSRRILRHVSQLLKGRQIKVLGTILNKSPLAAGNSYYSQYYKQK
ncbi:MAG: polysaccharide biosynthesis tyrosine autokinase [Candidatus Aureabacteria bacterium]|nr:polysaccharide biosynthesis tyrosine autokinase [Candidatus Auribacterota bacterium]